jgi:hypothetical protein
MELGSDLVIIASTIGDPMSHHWRSAVGRPDAIQGAGDHDVEYFGGWAVSALMAIATILLVWHFHV